MSEVPLYLTGFAFGGGSSLGVRSWGDRCRGSAKGVGGEGIGEGGSIGVTPHLNMYDREGWSGEGAVGVANSSDMMYLLISFRKSTPPQNRQLNIVTKNSKQQVDDFVVKLTF